MTAHNINQVPRVEIIRRAYIDSTYLRDMPKRTITRRKTTEDPVLLEIRPKSILKTVKNIPFGAKGRKRRASLNVTWSNENNEPNDTPNDGTTSLATVTSSSEQEAAVDDLIIFSEDESTDKEEQSPDTSLFQQAQQDYTDFIGEMVERKRVPGLLPISSLGKPKTYGNTKNTNPSKTQPPLPSASAKLGPEQNAVEPKKRRITLDDLYENANSDLMVPIGATSSNINSTIDFDSADITTGMLLDISE